MIGDGNRRLRMVFRLIVPLMMLLVFLPAFSAYALDSNYVISEYNGWIDIDERIDFQQKETGFDGFLKWIVDEENGCFYMYFSFYDVGLEGYDDDNTVISFDVWNDINRYHFSVNRNGYVNTGANEQKNIRLTYNFDNCSVSRCGGEILIGFELLNNTDRELYNHISCEYAGGGNKTAVLFSDYGLDMYVEPTVKVSSSKASKLDKSNKEKATDSRINGSTENDTSKKESSTKYTPTGTLSRNAKKEQSSKFNADKIYSSGDAADNHTEEKTVLNEAGSTVGTYRRSKTAVIILSVAGVMIAGGVALVIAGTVIKNKKSDSSTADSVNE